LFPFSQKLLSFRYCPPEQNNSSKTSSCIACAVAINSNFYPKYSFFIVTFLPILRKKIWWVFFFSTSLGFYAIRTDPQTDSCDDVTVTTSNVNLKVPYIYTPRGKGLSNMSYRCNFRADEWEKIWRFCDNFALLWFYASSYKKEFI